MQNSAELQLQAKEEMKQIDVDKVIIVEEKAKFNFMLLYSVIVLLSAFIFNSPQELISGLGRIAVDRSILVSDYMEIGNVGAAFLNAGILMVLCTFITKFNKVNMNGTTMAAIFTVGGFALFGKNIFNVWAIMAGVFLYSRYKGEKFSKFILIAFFGTALGPLVSQISFGLGFPVHYSVVAGYLAGILAGFLLPPLAAHFVKFHQGFNLYNLGFTCGIVGSLFMAIMRAFSLENEKRAILASGYNKPLGIYLYVFFATILVFGFVYNNKSFSGYGRLLKRSGRAVEDFVLLEGFGLTLINMAILGVITTSYVLLVKGQLNGPIIGGIITVVGFGAFGKHAKNILPIMVGVFLAATLMQWNVNATGPLLAALFGTTLAPIAGVFGWTGGIIAGFLHMAMVMNVGSLHGAMNLYNNGFSGGIIAAILVPVLESLRKEV